MRNILITSGTDTISKSDSTSSIDVHIHHNHYVNIVLPNGSILTVDSTTATLCDYTESLVGQWELS